MQVWRKFDFITVAWHAFSILFKCYFTFLLPVFLDQTKTLNNVLEFKKSANLEHPEWTFRSALAYVWSHQPNDTYRVHGWYQSCDCDKLWRNATREYCYVLCQCRQKEKCKPKSLQKKVCRKFIATWNLYHESCAWQILHKFWPSFWYINRLVVAPDTDYKKCTVV